MFFLNEILLIQFYCDINFACVNKIVPKYAITDNDNGKKEIIQFSKESAPHHNSLR